MALWILFQTEGSIHVMWLSPKLAITTLIHSTGLKQTPRSLFKACKCIFSMRVGPLVTKLTSKTDHSYRGCWWVWLQMQKYMFNPPKAKQDLHKQNKENEHMSSFYWCWRGTLTESVKYFDEIWLRGLNYYFSLPQRIIFYTTRFNL